MRSVEKSGLRKAGIWLAVTGLLILVITFFVFPSDTDCFVHINSECAIPNDNLYGLIIGMFVLTWAVVFFAAHGIVYVLRDPQS